MQQIAQGLWLVDGPVVRWWTMPFPTRMTLVRLDGGDLFVHSPIPLTPQVRSLVEAHGTPRVIVSPNKLHHLFMPPWREAYAGARLFAPPGLREKRPDLAFDGDLGDAADAAWSDSIDQILFAGSRALDEIVFFHKPTRTLILGDLVENFDPATLSPFHRAIARIGGVLAPDGKTPRDLQLSFRGHREEARDALRRMLAWKPLAVTMCHGLPVTENATAFLESAFAWLREPRARR